MENFGHGVHAIVYATRGEIIKSGLGELNVWEKQAKVSPKDIADADKKQVLTTAEVNGFGGFIKKLLDKIKGKGEK